MFEAGGIMDQYQGRTKDQVSLLMAQSPPSFAHTLRRICVVVFALGIAIGSQSTATSWIDVAEAILHFIKIYFIMFLSFLGWYFSEDTENQDDENETSQEVDHASETTSGDGSIGLQKSTTNTSEDDLIRLQKYSNTEISILWMFIGTETLFFGMFALGIIDFTAFLFVTAASTAAVLLKELLNNPINCNYGNYEKTKRDRKRYDYFEAIAIQAKLKIRDAKLMDELFRVAAFLVCNMSDTTFRRSIHETVCSLVQKRTRFLFECPRSKTEDLLELWEKWIDFLLVTAGSRQTLPKLAEYFQALLQLTASVGNNHLKHKHLRKGTLSGGTKHLREIVMRRCRALMKEGRWGKAMFQYRIQSYLFSEEEKAQETRGKTKGYLEKKIKERHLGTFLQIHINLTLDQLTTMPSENLAKSCDYTLRLAELILSEKYLRRSEKTVCVKLLWKLLCEAAGLLMEVPASAMSVHLSSNLESIEAPATVQYELLVLLARFWKICAISNQDSDQFGR
ncbi:expressed unknown protein [Seminavis robusta]|uniref:Uncharacterized protein n=1 Tax=Seminavis robusta TaxID=568900 RepID=A0A9N8EGX5_9STRA|nr:expressed unknown protein [Seminavis robusta]|eukprot:Sro1063_g237060.1 n/a (508) ;mRNA; f:6214-7737